MALTVYKRQADLSFLLFCRTPCQYGVSFTINDFIPFSGSKGINFAMIGYLPIYIMLSTKVNSGAIVSVKK